MGGDCLNYGCVPSKALLAAARHASEPKRVVAVRPDSAARGDRLRQGQRARPCGDRRDRAERFEGALHRPRRAGDRRRGALHRQGDRRGRRRITIKARRFVIATGSSPAVPPIPGLSETPHLTNETIFDLKRCPGASHRHRRRADRAGARAGASPARRQGDGAGSRNAARQRRPRMRRDRARAAGARRRRRSARAPR